MDTGTIIVTIMLLAILVLPFYAAQRSKRKQSNKFYPLKMASNLHRKAGHLFFNHPPTAHSTK